ncbi:hypothetical protein GGS23DRAFT_548217 [Durotheca rogersii]|uniref:uncharacterized protein n=1 Tax=Durotheca rogersii TaxID=419775 RepID=UPI0022210A70|nr:uncharacterized protein GGS23DRAFT_548217 [Durotheca rogersii]KAI5867395.1 hypothetical protein GGS23DRAFT_548217 [Durotheca rogersii]
MGSNNIIFDLDDINMPTQVQSHYLGSGSVSAYFRAVPSVVLHPPFNNFSSLSCVIYESAEKLVVLIHHNDVEAMNGFKQAWVSRYRRFGDYCMLTLAPPSPNGEPIEVIYEYLGDIMHRIEEGEEQGQGQQPVDDGLNGTHTPDQDPAPGSGGESQGSTGIYQNNGDASQDSSDAPREI